MTVFSLTPAGRALGGGVALLLLVLMARCAGPQAVAPPPPDEAPAPRGPAYTTVFFDASGLQQRDERTGATTALLPGATFYGPVAPAPDGDRLVFGYATPDSAHLARLDLATGALETLHSGAPGTVYTVAWAPEGDALAFGFYTPRRTPEGAEEMGPGGIRRVDAAGVHDVGCRAARAVEAWLPDGHLVVRDQRQWDRRTLYVVTPDGCADRARIDARKLFDVTFSADGQWMAYLERNLSFDRQTRAYRPDSTLYVADAYGRNPRKVADADARPRHLVWAPRDAQLAYDRLGPDGTFRQIYLYDARDGKLSVLTQNPVGDETNLVWSPSATNFVFDRKLGATTFHKVVRIFGGYRVVDESDTAAGLARTWGWLDDERLVLLDGDLVRVVHPAAQTADTLAAGLHLLALRAR